MSDTSSSRNQQIIDELLADAGMEDAGDLRPVLLELRALAADSPRPSAAVEALMAPAATFPAAAGAVDQSAVDQSAVAQPAVEHSAVEKHAVEQPAVDELAARRRRKRRLPLTAFSVAAALAAGGAAAAASDENFRHTLGDVRHAVTVVVGTLTSGTGTTGRPSPENGGTVPGPPATAPTTPGATPADGGSSPGGQAGGTTADPATPSPGTAGTPGHSLPDKLDPRDPGTITDPGQQLTGKPLPSSPVSPDPSELIPAPPVEVPELPGPLPSK